MGVPTTENLIPAGYIVREEAIEALGSKATVERLVSSHQLRSQLVHRDGVRPMRVYLAEDVERLKVEREDKSEARPPSALEPRRSASGVPASVFVELVNTVREIALAQREMKQLPAPPHNLEVPLQHKLWLSLREAHAYSGLPHKLLRQLVRDDVLVSVGSGHGQRILRKSLDAFEG